MNEDKRPFLRLCSTCGVFCQSQGDWNMHKRYCKPGKPFNSSETKKEAEVKEKALPTKEAVKELVSQTEQTLTGVAETVAEPEKKVTAPVVRKAGRPKGSTKK